ncbi:TetR/AcrR family transcriptional regulator [Dyadobacter luteus]|jgi:AcrR family transcriptional regulator|uniref:TetR/AcrR family transcriptional regulator n=1 Tax=Dyadobacter luteus TaxID=2259619 RepID=A0A3D8Y2Q2_9BACT|nr:TetR family transcriptional regulator [Dyadobacter luteus]REA55959.1 TetR/AcrR family transcriptional regulator [Dyadobacter luteus]
MEYSAKQLQIIAVAEKLFSKKGFEGTSVRDIAEVAEVNVSMISYYFGSKDKLIEALFELRITESRLRIEHILLLEDLTPLQKVNIMIDSTVDRLIDNEQFQKIMMREQLSSERTTIVSKYIRDMKIRNSELMKRLITEGQEAGYFRKNIDMSLLSITLYGTIHHAIATQDYYKTLNNIEHLSGEEFRSFLKMRLKRHLKSLFKSAVFNENHT